MVKMIVNDHEIVSENLKGPITVSKSLFLMYYMNSESRIP